MRLNTPHRFDDDDNDDDDDAVNRFRIQYMFDVHKRKKRIKTTMQMLAYINRDHTKCTLANMLHSVGVAFKNEFHSKLISIITNKLVELYCLVWFKTEC